jgi:hypothetical protein
MRRLGVFCAVCLAACGGGEQGSVDFIFALANSAVPIDTARAVDDEIQFIDTSLPLPDSEVFMRDADFAMDARLDRAGAFRTPGVHTVTLNADGVEVSKSITITPPTEPVDFTCNIDNVPMREMTGTDVVGSDPIVPTFLTWGCPNDDTGALSNTDGSGNSAAIHAAACNATAPGAAAACDALVAHGHDDWYLPAPLELGCTTKGAVDAAAALAGQYWSSQEINFNNAVAFRFGTGDVPVTDSKANQKHVRCFRKP